ELHRRYGKVARTRTRPSGPAAQVRVGGEPNNKAPARKSLPTARDSAERHILGVLLLEPARWHDVQQTVDPSDFTDEARRRLAEVYWTQQRDEGEPVFNQLLGHLAEIGGESMVELAVEMADEAQDLPSLDDALAGALL